MGTLSLQRSKQLLERQGYAVWIVEHWNQWAHIRQDFMGFADLLAIRADQKGVTAIQACGEDVQSHCHKLLEGWHDEKKEKDYTRNTYLPIWLIAGNTFFVWSWRKRGERGKAKRWTLLEIEFYVRPDGTVDVTETGATHET